MAGVKRDRRPASVGVPILPVRSMLPNLLKPEPNAARGYLTRLQNRDRAHTYATRIV